MMQVSLAGTGIWLSDGATNIMPVGPHRGEEGKPLTPRQREKTATWSTARGSCTYEHIHAFARQRLLPGLGPASGAVRRRATRPSTLSSSKAWTRRRERLKNFVEKAAQATLVGDVFDDAATGQGLLNFFLRGINCGAITEREAQATGLTLEEIRGRSFVKILDARRKK